MKTINRCYQVLLWQRCKQLRQSKVGVRAVPLAARLPLCKTELGSLELSAFTSLNSSQRVSPGPVRMPTFSYFSLTLVFVAVFCGLLFSPPLLVDLASNHPQ